MPIAKLFAIAFIFAALHGCATTDPTANWDAERFYNEAREALLDKNYERAVQLYETLEARYPFGSYAQQAQLEIAYAYYKFQQPESAVAAADRFIRLNPKHEHVPYAFYVKGLANFNRDRGLFDDILKDPADRDPEPLQRAFDDFKQLVNSYPDSRYAADARQRMIYLRNVLARHEMQVADYYLRRGAWVAAVNRAEHVLENHQGSQSVPDALNTLVFAYRRLGMDDLADDALHVLESNYPDRIEKRNRS